MAASAWLVHNKVKEYLGNKVIDFDNDSFSMTLHPSGSNVHDPATDAYSTVNTELSTQFGYTAGGIALTGVDWSSVGATSTFTCNQAQWTASGGDIVAWYAAIRDTTVTSPVVAPIICSCILSDPGANVTATDGNTFTVQINASGVFTLT